MMASDTLVNRKILVIKVNSNSIATEEKVYFLPSIKKGQVHCWQRSCHDSLLHLALFASGLNTKKNKVWKILIIIQRKRTLKLFFPHEGLFRANEPQHFK